MYSGDPKRPKNITYYPNTQPEDQPDILQFLSMILGIISFMFKVKWGIWLSLIFFLSSWANSKNNSEMKNTIMSFSMIMMGFVTTYLARPRTPAPPKDAPK